MSLIVTEGEVAVLRGCCVGNKRNASEMIDSLGLINDNVRSAPKFTDPDVVELYKAIGLEVDQLTMQLSGGKTITELQTELQKEETLSKHVDAVANKFGEKIWGRAKRSHLFVPGLKSLYPKALFWDCEKDRKDIQFYLRCWIIKRAFRRIGNDNRKTNLLEKNQQSKSAEKLSKKLEHKTSNVIDLSDIESSDSESGIDISPNKSITPTTMRGGIAGGLFRAPPARMRPTPQPLSNVGLANTSSSRMTGVEAMDDSDSDGLYADPPKSRSPQEPGKRKRVDTQQDTTPGKLPKVSVWGRTENENSRHTGGIEDPYDVPHSPSTVFESASFRIPFSRRKARHGTPDSDRSFRPSPSVETDQGDIDHVMMEEMGSAEVQFGSQRLVSTSPPPFYRRDSVIRDSVIPNDTTDHIKQPSTGFTRDISTLEREDERTRLQSSTIIPNESSMPPSKPWEEKELRRELFKLLLSYLNNINEFRPEQSNSAFTERLNHLLLQFWINDMETLQLIYRDRFVQLHVAFRSWMDIRARIQEFRVSAQYYGKPGDEWKKYLREITEPRKRAEACIALADLLDGVNGAKKFPEQNFDEDLCTVFDQLTQFPGCNGAEEFEGVKMYNENLLAWFR